MKPFSTIQLIMTNPDLPPPLPENIMFLYKIYQVFPLIQGTVHGRGRSASAMLKGGKDPAKAFSGPQGSTKAIIEGRRRGYTLEPPPLWFVAHPQGY